MPKKKIVVLAVSNEGAALSGALIGVLIEKGLLTMADLELILARSRELGASDACENVVNLRDRR